MISDTDRNIAPQSLRGYSSEDESVHNERCPEIRPNTLLSGIKSFSFKNMKRMGSSQDPLPYLTKVMKFGEANETRNAQRGYKRNSSVPRLARIVKPGELDEINHELSKSLSHLEFEDRDEEAKAKVERGFSRNDSLSQLKNFVMESGEMNETESVGKTLRRSSSLSQFTGIKGCREVIKTKEVERGSSRKENALSQLKKFQIESLSNLTRIVKPGESDEVNHELSKSLSHLEFEDRGNAAKAARGFSRNDSLSHLKYFRSGSMSHLTNIIKPGEADESNFRRSASLSLIPKSTRVDNNYRSSNIAPRAQRCEEEQIDILNTKVGSEPELSRLFARAKKDCYEDTSRSRGPRRPSTEKETELLEDFPPSRAAHRCSPKPKAKRLSGSGESSSASSRRNSMKRLSGSGENVNSSSRRNSLPSELAEIEISHEVYKDEEVEDDNLTQLEFSTQEMESDVLLFDQDQDNRLIL